MCVCVCVCVYDCFVNVSFGHRLAAISLATRLEPRPVLRRESCPRARKRNLLWRGPPPWLRQQRWGRPLSIHVIESKSTCLKYKKCCKCYTEPLFATDTVNTQWSVLIKGVSSFLRFFYTFLCVAAWYVIVVTRGVPISDVSIVIFSSIPVQCVCVCVCMCVCVCVCVCVVCISWISVSSVCVIVMVNKGKFTL